MAHKKKSRINWKLIADITNGYKRYLVLGCAAVLLHIVFSYTIPLVTSFTIDYAIGGQDISMPAFIERIVDDLGGHAYFSAHLYISMLLIIGLTVLNGSVSFLRGRSISYAAESSAKVLRDKLYAHLQRVPYDYHKHASAGDLIQRCTSDVNTVRRFISMQLMQIVRTVFLVGIAGTIMFSINVKMTLISLCTIPFLFFASYFYFKKVRKYFTKSDEAEGKLSSTLQENLTGVRVVRAFGQQQNELKRFTEKNTQYSKISYTLSRLMAYYWGGMDIMSYAQTMISALAGIYLAATTDTFTLGNVVLFSTYTGMLTWPVRQLGRVLSDMGKATVAMERIDEILSVPEEQEPGKNLTPPIRGDIRFDNVYFGYDSYDEVLKGISFSIKAGQTIAILGATGSGKSSLVHLLQRLYPCSAGHIYLDGVDVNDINAAYLRKHIGMVLQEPFLYSRTILDNIRITDPSASNDDVYSAARVASIHNVILGFEKGYDTIVGERGVTLSGGQQQRVAIARTLMQKAPILIFDDSMSAIDTETDLSIRQALKAARGQRTTIIISHRITTLRESDRILVLDQGRLVQEGTHEELMAADGIYSHIAHIQAITADIGQTPAAQKGGEQA